MAAVIHLLSGDDRSVEEGDTETFARDVLVGLSAEQKFIPAEYHYDAAGSRLFDRITELPEYYLTRCETEALKENRNQIAESLDGRPANVIEFGPGDGSKTRTLLDHLLRRGLDFRYIAVDISTAALEQLADDYEERFPELDIDCLAADYFAGLKWLRDRYQESNLVLFLGSSIGNFRPSASRSFLSDLHKNINDGDQALIGFDLAKDPEVIHRAYNDSEDVTAAFNLNILERINRELGGTFDTSKFRYEGIYDRAEQVVKSYLVSLEDQEVGIEALERTFDFPKGESIHTEDSYKYRESDIETLASRTGFTIEENLYDSRGYFVDSLWRA